MSLLLLARIVAAVFGLVALGSVLWFGSALSPTFITAALLLGFSSAVAFFPRRALASASARKILFTLCVIGIVAGLVLITGDVSSPYGIEWDVVAMRLVHIAALATIAIKASERSAQLG